MTDTNYIFQDHGRKALIEKRQDAIFEAFDNLKEYTAIILGEKFEVDYIKYLSDPVTYLSENYYENFAVKLPEHLKVNKLLVMERDTTISRSEIIEAYRNFNQAFTVDRELAPKISKKDGLVSIVKPEHYTYEIPAAKREYYDKSLVFVKALNDLTAISDGNSIDTLLKNFFFGKFKNNGHDWEIIEYAFK